MSDSKNNEFPKLSRKEFLVLGMLIGRGEMFGLEMVEASEGELKRGTIYVTNCKIFSFSKPAKTY